MPGRHRSPQAVRSGHLPQPGRHYRPEAVRSERRIHGLATVAQRGILAACTVALLGGSAPAITMAAATSGHTGRTATAVTARSVAGVTASPSSTTAPTASPSASATTRAMPVHAAKRAASAPKTTRTGTVLTPDVINVATDIPLIALRAYKAAANWSTKHQASCHVTWPYLAAFGRIESDHGRFNGSMLLSSGVATPAIYGPALPSIKDKNGKPVRAAGPMQFIPSTWALWGTGSPQSINNATMAAATYLCAGGRDMATAQGRHDGAFSYNHAEWYATDIEALYQAYLHNRALTAYPVGPPPTPKATAKPTASKTAKPEPKPKPERPTRSHAPTARPTKPSPSRSRPKPKRTSPRPKPSASSTTASITASPSP